MAKSTKRDPSNPILNSPYGEPEFHYATDGSGNLNYDDVRESRRIFTPDTPTIPLAQTQPGMFDMNDLAREYTEHLINLARHEISAWRAERYRRHSRVTRDLLDYWFRPGAKTASFFAQRGGRNRHLVE